MTTERRINLRFTSEHFDKIDEKRFKSRLSFQELGMRLFDEWLASDRDMARHSSLRKPADLSLEKLAILQARGDRTLLALALKTIDMSYSVLQQTITPQEMAHLRAVAYGEAPPPPKPEKEAMPKRRGRPRKIA